MKVLLVTSPHLNHAAHQEGVVPLAADRGKLAQTFVPMGLLSLACAVGPGIDVEIADVNKAINRGELPMSGEFYRSAAEWVLRWNPDLVGWMTEADSYHHVLKVCIALKAERPSVTTLLGGPHASAVHAETIRAVPAIDFIIRGEGEPAFAQLAYTLASEGVVDDVPNLTYRTGLGDIVSTPVAPLINDLDTLPWPELERLEVEPDDAVFLEVGRGCPFSCNFCFTAPYWQRRHRIKSPARIISEIRYLRDVYGRRDLNFTHDLFTTNRRWVLDFCRALSASDLGVTWTCSSRTDTIDEEQIEAMQRAGCRNIYFGVEAGTQEMQARIQKNLDLVEARRVIKATAVAGIGVTVGFIAGLPGESAETLRGTLVEGWHYLGMPESTVHLFGYSPYRGSAIFDQIQNQIVFDRLFVDFPLGAETHGENCDFMSASFELFSRYSWLRRYRGVSRATLRAAEEFFPIVNAVQSLIVDLRDRDVDPYELLVAWSSWIARKNQGASDAGRYRGTIEDFLTFCSRFLRRRGFIDSRLQERLEWELHKNRLRLEPAASHALPETSAAATRIRPNPTLRLERFSYAPDFASSRPREAAPFAFFLRTDGSPRILRLPRLGELLVGLAERGVDREELREAAAWAIAARNPAAAAGVQKLLRRLEREQVLLPAA